MSARPRRAAAQAADIARQAARGAPVIAPGRSRGGESLSTSDAANTADGVENSTPLQPGLTAAATSEAVSASALDRGKRTVALKAPSKRPAHTGASSSKASSTAPSAKRSRKAAPEATPASDEGQSAPIATSTAAPAPPAASPARPSTTASAHAPPHAPAPTLLPPTLSFSLPNAIAHLSRADPRFALMFAHVPIKPFAPPLEAIDPFRTLVTSIIGQQVSWMAARAINARFRGLFGYGDGTVVKSESGESGVNVEVDEGYPSPEEVAGREVLELKSVGLSLRKAEYVQSLAQHFVSGALTTELLRDGTDEEVAKALIAVRGIGQWTVDMFLMFSLRRPDVLPVGDLGVQKGLLRWFLAAHGALPQSTRVAKGKGKGKGKVKAEDGDGVVAVVKKEGKAAEAARKKYAPAPATPVTPMRMREERTAVKLEPVDDVDGLQDRRMVTPPPPITTARHAGRGELDTLIATPPPSRQFGEEDHVEPSGKRYQLPPTPLTPGGTANTDSPDSTDAGAPIVKIGALHTPITPAPRPSFGNSNGETSGRSLPQLPPTPLSPGPSVSVLAASSGARGSKRAAAPTPVPVIPQETLEIPSTALPSPPPPSGDQLLHPPAVEWLKKEGLEWDAGNAAPMEEGLSVEVLKSRLSGKKVKGGAYLTPLEMERMTEHWKPYRSLGVYYMWPAGEEF